MKSAGQLSAELEAALVREIQAEFARLNTSHFKRATASAVTTMLESSLIRLHRSPASR